MVRAKCLWAQLCSRFPRRSRRPGQLTPVAALETLEERICLSAGALDPSFGDGGVVVTDIPEIFPTDDFGRSVLLQPDGKTVIVGSAGNRGMALVRLDADGNLDVTFGDQGVTTTRLSSSGSQQTTARAAALQTDGKIVVAGSSGGEFAVARFNPDGTLDTTLDEDGFATLPFYRLGGSAEGVVIQPDGKIVVGGWVMVSTIFTGQWELAIARFNSDGTPDTTFDGDGRLTRSLTQSWHEDDFTAGSHLALQSDGKLLMAGVVDQDSFLIRFNGDGSVDTDFAEDGAILDLPFAGSPSSLSLQADGKILVSDVSTLIRLLPDGDLDESFDGDGLRPLALRGLSTTVQPDGRILVAGEQAGGGPDNFAVSRFHSDGSPDTTFDGDGFLSLSLSPEGDYARSAAVLADGRIIAAGTAQTGTGWDFAALRLQSDGSTDSDFGDNGSVLVNIATNAIPRDNEARAVAVQTDGKIVIAGSAPGQPSGTEFALARYNADGTLDATFGTNGTVVARPADETSAIGEAQALAIQADGRIVVVGGQGAGSIARYTTAGELDTSFHADGFRRLSIDSAQAVAIQPDGKILVAGYHYSLGDWQFAVMRVNPNGSLDGSFGTNGRMLTDFGSGAERAYDIAIQPDGKFVLAGSNGNFILARYNTDGSLDTTFDGDGKATIAMNGVNRIANSVTIQPDGRIVAAGHLQHSSGGVRDFALVRLLPNGSLDASFGTGGRVVTALSTVDDIAHAVLLQEDGKVIAAGSRGNQFAAVRYLSDGTLDTSFDGDGIAIADVGTGADHAYGAALQPDGKLVLAGRNLDGGDANFALARYLTSDPAPERTGSTLNVPGTAGNDTIEVRLGSEILVKLNGREFEFSAAGLSFVRIVGAGGDDSLLLAGTPADESAVLRPGTVRFTSGGLQVTGTDIATITVDGGGGHDEAQLIDSEGDDEFIGRATIALLTGNGFLNRVRGFARVDGYGRTGGNDRARLYDTAGDDVYLGRSTVSYLNGPSAVYYARGFSRVDAYSLAGGNDRALLHDTPGDESFQSTSAVAVMRGSGFTNFARSFARVDGLARAGGSDVAVLHDSSGDDVFRGRPTVSFLVSPGATAYARGFDRVEAVSEYGGSDRAFLYDSPGNDTFIAGERFGRMFLSTYEVVATGFPRIDGYSRQGGTDRARLYDSPGDDRLKAYSHQTFLVGSTFTNYAREFERVDAYSESGGADRAWLYDSSGDDVFTSREASASFSGFGYENIARGFARAFATARSGRDTALLEDVRNGAHLTGQADRAELSRLARRDVLTGFDRIEAHARPGHTPSSSIDPARIDYEFEQFGDWN